ncbi:MAG: dUTP diphosphatase [Alphaproteobacteria bacterium]|nr:dUTP diphosphatase [Alphaproteobacteria bacterium]
MTQITVKLIKSESGKDLPTPKYATAGSAGMDLYADTQGSITLAKGKKMLISTGISIGLPEKYEAQIRPRSGLAAKNGITVLNTPGTIDSDYTGEIKVILINLSDEDFIIERGMRIAQMIIAPVTTANFIETESLEETDRGTSGFGSTGVKA